MPWTGQEMTLALAALYMVGPLELLMGLSSFCPVVFKSLKGMFGTHEFILQDSIENGSFFISGIHNKPINNSYRNFE